MSQSLTQLKSIYLKNNLVSHRVKKNKHLKSLSQVPGKSLGKLNKPEKKQENCDVPTVKHIQNDHEKLSIKIKCDEDFIRLENLGARSTLARTGLLALQQRIIELEYAKAIKTPRSIGIDEKNWRIVEEDRIDRLYDKYHHSPGNASPIKSMIF
ncbi:unnamed protein product [Blepharisma stoltei]|uniref:Uncharacterized protein n=1 Tax=Blepharisma stoltei TaxID=1481888 RepID=A0AAU9JDY8_9CILI|nr:unnamed protein product [Blepharisma stoltei]